MAFVTYGTADTRPTPLLAKRFFVPFQTQVTKELCEQTKNLGIGLTSSGGNRGMAALEGLVAAVEVSWPFSLNLNGFARRFTPRMNAVV
jgi:hypothetical protein